MKKEEIFEKILPLAAERGLRSLSTADIAAAAGLKKSSLYSHFESKSDLIKELYVYLRKKTFSSAPADYSSFVKGKSLREILIAAALSYDERNRSSDMKAFYRVIISEKTMSKDAAGVIIRETETMIEATERLFSAIEEEGIAVFRDDAALSYALLIHSVLDLRLDAEMAESSIAEGMLERIIDSFINAYVKEE